MPLNPIAPVNFKFGPTSSIASWRWMTTISACSGLNWPKCIHCRAYPQTLGANTTLDWEQQCNKQKDAKGSWPDKKTYLPPDMQLKDVKGCQRVVPPRKPNFNRRRHTEDIHGLLHQVVTRTSSTWTRSLGNGSASWCEHFQWRVAVGYCIHWHGKSGRPRCHLKDLWKDGTGSVDCIKQHLRMYALLPRIRGTGQGGSNPGISCTELAALGYSVFEFRSVKSPSKLMMKINQGLLTPKTCNLQVRVSQTEWRSHLVPLKTLVWAREHVHSVELFSEVTLRQFITERVKRTLSGREGHVQVGAWPDVLPKFEFSTFPEGWFVLFISTCSYIRNTLLAQLLLSHPESFNRIRIPMYRLATIPTMIN